MEALHTMVKGDQLKLESVLGVMIFKAMETGKNCSAEEGLQDLNSG